MKTLDEKIIAIVELIEEFEDSIENLEGQLAEYMERWNILNYEYNDKFSDFNVDSELERLKLFFDEYDSEAEEDYFDDEYNDDDFVNICKGSGLFCNTCEDLDFCSQAIVTVTEDMCCGGCSKTSACEDMYNFDIDPKVNYIFKSKGE